MSVLPWEEARRAFADEDSAWVADAAATAAWDRARARETDTAIRGSERYARVLTALLRYRGAVPLDAPRLYGRTWFRVGADEDGWRVLVSDEPTGPWAGVVGASDVSMKSLDFFFPSPEGRYVALGVSTGGSEHAAIRVVDVGRKALLADELPNASFGHVAWLPDETGFFHSRSRSPEILDPRQALFRHALGDPAAVSPEPLAFDEPAVFSEVSPDGRFVIAFDGEDRLLRYVLDTARGDGWREVDGPTGPLRQGFFDGESYVAISHLACDRGRVVRVPLATPGDTSSWETLVAETDSALRGLSRAGRFMVLVGLANGSASVAIKTLEGRHVADVPLPDEGAVALTPSILQPPLAPLVWPAGESVSFLFTSCLAPPVPYMYSIGERRLTRLCVEERVPEGVSKERATAMSADGTAVPITLLYRGALREQPRPTLVYAYGGWNVALTPSYLAEFNVLLDAGVVVAMPSLRGGGENGEAFWNAGRREHLQVTSDDVHATAEWLVEQGITSPRRLGVVGASNGGLVACAAASQRPDLFGAVVAAVPLTDLLNYTRDPITWSFICEYGDPVDPNEREHLRRYSPYHTIPEECDCPATLVISTDLDIRCPAWHGRKFAARLARSNNGTRPVLFRLWRDSGHMEFEAGRPEHAAEWLTFVLDQLGVGLASNVDDDREAPVMHRVNPSRGKDRL